MPIHILTPGQKGPAAGAARVFAHVVSWLFHPLFIVAWITAYLLFLHPYAYAGAANEEKLTLFFSIFFNTVFLPGFAVFLMWQLRLIASIFMRTQQERIIPLAVTMIFYFWTWYVRISLSGTPVLLKEMLMGAFLGVCAAWILNIPFKVSMHSIAAGGLAVFFITSSFAAEYTSGIYPVLALIISGSILTARMQISDHSGSEIYIGWLAGAFCQLFAWSWYHLF